MLVYIKNTIKMMQELDADTLQVLKYSLIGLIVVDIFGFWWYFNLKKLGTALLLVFMGCLTIILLLERRLPENMAKREVEINGVKYVEKEEKPKKAKKKVIEIEGVKYIQKEEDENKPEEKEKKEGMFDNLGLPSSEEYNKRVEESFGSI